MPTNNLLYAQVSASHLIDYCNACRYNLCVEWELKQLKVFHESSLDSSSFDDVCQVLGLVGVVNYGWHDFFWVAQYVVNDESRVRIVIRTERFTTLKVYEHGNDKLSTPVNTKYWETATYNCQSSIYLIKVESKGSLLRIDLLTRNYWLPSKNEVHYRSLKTSWLWTELKRKNSTKQSSIAVVRKYAKIWIYEAVYAP